MQCLLLSSKNTHWISLNDSNTGLLPWQQAKKARAKGPSSDSAQSLFTCSICNRQFRAKIGLYSHQRTHKHTYTPNIQDVRWSFSVMRDEQSANSKTVIRHLTANMPSRNNAQGSYSKYLSYIYAVKSSL